MQIPSDSTAVDFVDEVLRQAELAVQLLGDKLGYAPEDADPIVALLRRKASYV
jgi:hypothetical protein